MESLYGGSPPKKEEKNMTNWEFITKNKIIDVFNDTIEKLITSNSPEEWLDAEDQAINIQWLLKERKETIDPKEAYKNVQLSEDQRSNI